MCKYFTQANSYFDNFTFTHFLKRSNKKKKVFLCERYIIMCFNRETLKIGFDSHLNATKTVVNLSVIR